MKDDLTTEEKLNLETAIISWKELQICFAQGKLLIIEPNSDLIEVASMFAGNNSEQLGKLIENKQVAFATPEWIRNSCTDNTKLWAVVIAPYVIAQLDNN